MSPKNILDFASEPLLNKSPKLAWQQAWKYNKILLIYVLSYGTRRVTHSCQLKVKIHKWSHNHQNRRLKSLLFTPGIISRTLDSHTPANLIFLFKKIKPIYLYFELMCEKLLFSKRWHFISFVTFKSTYLYVISFANSWIHVRNHTAKKR